ncbi:hypothetical protein AVEN_257307-1 [Araneus ventricosus]|uniref:Uncharacterized protein n=1 Tax=Araneus ventricosus TaxID=182803 RepID=A0A4Y2NLW8_ARAVE|nr:hypothetical protein AVEN_257307-1 [Araneus ventricosus]
MSFLSATFSNILAVAGHKSFSGPIGQQLNCCEKLPVVDYEIINSSIPDIDRNLLSKGNSICWTFQMQSPWELSRRLGKSGPWSFVPFQMANRGQPTPYVVYKIIISIRKLNRNSWLQTSS